MSPDVFMVGGPGWLDGDELLLTGSVACTPGGSPIHGRFTLGFVYSAETDTLTDDFGVAWHRA